MKIRMLAAAAASMVLVACGGGDGGAETASSAPPPVAPAPSQPTVPVVRYDIAVTAVDVTTPIAGGGATAYVLTVANTGPDAATDVALAVTADAQQTLGKMRCSASGGATCPANPVASMSVPSLPSGGSLTFTVPTTTTPVALGTVGGTLTVTAAKDTDAANNSARSTVQVVAPNRITLTSDAGDYIGQGRTYSYTNTNATLKFSATGRRLGIDVAGDQDWFATFDLPSALTRLEPGTYRNMTRWPFHVPANGGLDWSGEGRGCNTQVGSVTIRSVTYAADVLQAIDFDFEQHCEGAVAALRGQIHWTAYDSATGPGPVNPPPAGLWSPTNITLPSGSHIYLVSDSGDYIGAGRTYLYEPGTATATVTSNGRQLKVSVDGWSADFVGMNSVPLLQPGYYGNLQRYPFHNGTRGGLNWSGNGRGCNTLSGWFVVDEVTYVGTTLKSIDLRFEQHCEGFAAALRGRVRWAL